MTRWALVLTLGCASVRNIPAPEIAESQRKAAPPQADAHYVRGRLALLQGDLEGARAAFSLARVFDPESPHIPIALGEVALVGGDIQAAATSWEEATRVDPKSAKAWMYRARVARLSGQSSAAAQHYRQARKLGYGWQAWAGEIDAYLHAKARVEAQAVMDQWVLETGLSPEAAAERGQRRLRLGDPEGAAGDLFPTTQSHPEDLGRARRWVAAVLLLTDRQPAMLQAESLRLRAPDATAPLWAMAVLAHAEDDGARLKAVLETWTALAPGDPALIALRERLQDGGSQ